MKKFQYITPLLLSVLLVPAAKAADVPFQNETNGEVTILLRTIDKSNNAQDLQRFTLSRSNDLQRLDLLAVLDGLKFSPDAKIVIVAKGARGEATCFGAKHTLKDTKDIFNALSGPIAVADQSGVLVCGTAS